MLASLLVPHECYQKARSSRNRDGDRSRNGRRGSIDDEVAPSALPPATFRPYMPYAAAAKNPPDQIAVSVNQQTSRDFSPATTGPILAPTRTGVSAFQLVPLDRLQSTSAQTRRERLDEEVLRSFRME